MRGILVIEVKCALTLEPFPTTRTAFGCLLTLWQLLDVLMENNLTPLHNGECINPAQRVRNVAHVH